QALIDDTIQRIIVPKHPKFFNINFAFIDGWHTYTNVKHDFSLVSFCKRVLFHDADIEGINRFVKEIGGKIFDGTKFAYWEDM
ncbi:MAG: hypothetical protein KKH44_08390, partial [Bacteroidetes bacterium]|nr:hypothetical protein [Bacteroidota bacterium]